MIADSISKSASCNVATTVNTTAIIVSTIMLVGDVFSSQEFVKLLPFYYLISSLGCNISKIGSIL